MVTFTLKKLLTLAVLLVSVAILSHTIVSFSPVDPVRAYIGEESLQVSAEQRHRIEEHWGQNQSSTMRLVHWSNNLVHGDWGQSTLYRRPVIDIIAERVLLSIPLLALAWLLSGVVGYLLGLIAGTYARSPLDRAIRLYLYFAASAPAFWTAMLLLIVFSIGLGWTPSCCASPPGQSVAQVSIGVWLQHLVLPVAALSLTGVASVALHTRQKMLDVFQSDYAMLARTQGASRWQIVWHHGIRNVSLPAVQVHFASFSELFGGAVLAEQVFAYPGLGQATVAAGVHGDVPLLLAITLFSCVFVFVGNLLADILSQRLAPVRLVEAT